MRGRTRTATERPRSTDQSADDNESQGGAPIPGRIGGVGHAQEGEVDWWSEAYEAPDPDAVCEVCQEISPRRRGQDTCFA